MHPHPLFRKAADNPFIGVGAELGVDDKIVLRIICVRQIQRGAAFDMICEIILQMHEDGDDWDVKFPGQDYRTGWGMGRLVEEFDENTRDSGVLVDKHADGAALVQTADDLPGAGAASDIGIACLVPHVDDDFVQPFILESGADDAQWVAILGHPSAEQLPVAKVAGDHQHALAGGECLVQVVNTLGSDQGVEALAEDDRKADGIGEGAGEMAIYTDP